MFALILGGLAEVCMVYALNKSEGFKNKLWSLLVIIFTICSLTCLSIAMNHIDMGIAYSIWVGLGSVGSIILGFFVFKEKLTLQQICFMILIIVAVIGLKLS